jgi:hypothetical protein
LTLSSARRQPFGIDSLSHYTSISGNGGRGVVGDWRQATVGVEGTQSWLGKNQMWAFSAKAQDEIWLKRMSPYEKKGKKKHSLAFLGQELPGKGDVGALRSVR